MQPTYTCSISSSVKTARCGLQSNRLRHGVSPTPITFLVCGGLLAGEGGGVMDGENGCGARWGEWV